MPKLTKWANYLHNLSGFCTKPSTNLVGDDWVAQQAVRVKHMLPVGTRVTVKMGHDSTRSLEGM